MLAHCACTLGIVGASVVDPIADQGAWPIKLAVLTPLRTDSDFDLLAVRSDNTQEDIEDCRNRLADALAGAGVGVDLAVCTASEFNEFRDLAGSLIRSVHDEGREVYVSPAERRRRKAIAA